MKYLTLFVCIFILGCSERIDDASTVDCGKVKIGNNLYLKKIRVGSLDKVYFLVNERDEIISGTSGTYRVGKVEVSVSSVTK
jgi:hypothetical protein